MGFMLPTTRYLKPKALD